MTEAEAYICGYFDFDAVSDQKDREKIMRAYTFAKKVHGSQKRKSGEDYFCHPVAVANILFKEDCDVDTICAALLHDTVEDTATTIEEIETLFGPDVARIVDGVTKITGLSAHIEELQDLKIESLRKWFQEMQRDIRVAIVKLADRIHNLQTLTGHQNNTKEKKIAQVSLDVFARIAHRLGIKEWSIKIEDLSFIHLYHDEYLATLHIKEKIVAKGHALEKELKEHLVHDHVPNFRIEYEVPGVYEFYQYLQTLPPTQFELENIGYRMNIVVESEEDCYKMLYALHRYYRRKKGSFEDYVNTPHVNGYRGLHTNILLPDGTQILLRIRDKQMDEYAKRGVISLLKNSDFDPRTYKLPWMNMLQYVINDTHGSSDSFLDSLDKDVLKHSVIVYGRGDHVYLLPEHATVLDALFLMIGEKTFFISTVYLNGIEVPLFSILVSGGKVNYTLKKEKIYDPCWLSWCETSLSKSFIKSELKSQPNERKVLQGKRYIEEMLMVHKRFPLMLWNDRMFLKLLKNTNRKSLDDVYIATAEGQLSREIILSTIGRREKSMFYIFTIMCRNEVEISEILRIIPIGQLSYLKVRPSRFFQMHPRISFKVQTDDNKKIEILYQTLLKHQGVVSLYFEPSYVKWHEYFYISILVGIWGLEPVLIKMLVHTTNDVILMTTSRFATISVLLGIYLLFDSRSILSMNMRFSKYTYKSILGGLSLLIIAFGTYYSLLTISPVFYNVSMCFITLLNLGILKAKSTLIYRYISYALLLISLLFALFQLYYNYDSSTLIVVVCTMLGYTFYSRINGQVDSELPLYSSYLKLLWGMHIIALVPSIAVLILSKPSWSFSGLGIMSLFSAIFVLIPLLLYRRYVLLNTESPIRVKLSILVGLIVTITAQIILLGEFMIPDLILEVSIFYLLFLSIASFSKKKKG